MRFTKWTLLTLILHALCASAVTVAPPDPTYSDYYYFAPLQSGRGAYNMLNWVRAGKPLPLPSQPYNRRFHFGGWIDDNRDDNCRNTRAKVLLETSTRPVTYTNSQQCTLASGEWLDPYTGIKVYKAKGVQIDHFVPLKQAYNTGAWSWDFRTRCLFGNYLFNRINLIPVSAEANQSKSDKAPDRWMPPNKKIWCAYVANWLKIKLTWNLAMTPPEAEAIYKVVQMQKCSPRLFYVDEQEILNERNTIRENYKYCDYNTPHGSQGDDPEGVLASKAITSSVRN